MNRTPFFTDLPVPDTLFSGGRVCGLHGQICTTRTIARQDNACHNDSKSSLSGYAYCQKISHQGQQPYFRTNYPAKINIASLTKHPGTCFALVFRNGNIRPEYFKPGLLKLRCSSAIVMLHVVSPSTLSVAFILKGMTLSHFTSEK